MDQKVDLEQAKYEIGITVNRLAHFYYHTVQNLIAEFGEEEAKRIMTKIISDFGTECGELTREKVAALGKENSILNHHLGKELPSLIFEGGKIGSADPKVKMTEITVCPYADAWKKIGFEKWGRLYCSIDQAKYKGYNENFVCYHDENMLDGDSRCIIRVVDTK